jgi:hypothetical protein
MQARLSEAIVAASAMVPNSLTMGQPGVSFSPRSISRVVNILLGRDLLTAPAYPFRHTAQIYHREIALI